ncbi:MAG TPA: 2OG-Fe(II) oxygenase [Hyphomicrobiales bacterium]|nr:2OG-Fe(II) oxygenase [Hyphomicrobiales bacterium]
MEALAETASKRPKAAETSLLTVPEPATIADHFCDSLRASVRKDWPFRHWALRNALPESLCIGVLILPIRPPLIDECGGVRDLDGNNSKRSFFTPKLQKDFPICAAFAAAFQRSEVASLFASTLGIAAKEITGSYLRIEYIQDTDGAWLKPHCDIPEKLFSMVIYLCTGPEAKNWGTDIYDAEKKWVARSSAEFNSAAIFVPGENTWHGFDKRPIIGVRRLMEVNYVRPAWRDREQLCFPERPIILR